MNKKQFAFILLGIWSIISWVLALSNSDAQTEYVAGQFGEGLEVVGFCIGFYLLLVIIALGITAIYQRLSDD